MASFFVHYFCIFKYLSYICHRKIEAVLAESGNSSNLKKYRDKLLLPMAGHASGSIYAGGLQRRGALKTCHSEFRHASGTASPFLKAKNLGFSESRFFVFYEFTFGTLFT